MGLDHIFTERHAISIPVQEQMHFKNKNKNKASLFISQCWSHGVAGASFDIFSSVGLLITHIKVSPNHAYSPF